MAEEYVRAEVFNAQMDRMEALQERTMAEVRSENAQLRNDFTAAIAEMRAENEKFRSEMQVTISRIEGQMGEMQGSISRLGTQVEANGKAIVELQAEVRQNSRDITEIKTKLDNRDFVFNMGLVIAGMVIATLIGIAGSKVKRIFDKKAIKDAMKEALEENAIPMAVEFLSKHPEFQAKGAV